MDLLSNQDFNLSHVLSKINQLESQICKELEMPDQELFYVIVCHPKSQESEKVKAKKKSTRQNLLFLVQEEHPVFNEKGFAFLSSPSSLLLEDDGLGGSLQSLLASNFLKVLSNKKKTQKLQDDLFYASHFCWRTNFGSGCSGKRRP